MKPDFLICDKCGSQNPEDRVPDSYSFWVTTGRSTGPAGSMECQGSNIDLCHKCAVRAIQHLVTTVETGKKYGCGNVLYDYIWPR